VAEWNGVTATSLLSVTSGGAPLTMGLAGTMRLPIWIVAVSGSEVWWKGNLLL
jgi:hypothetical protein